MKSYFLIIQSIIIVFKIFPQIDVLSNYNGIFNNYSNHPVLYTVIRDTLFIPYNDREAANMILARTQFTPHFWGRIQYHNTRLYAMDFTYEGIKGYISSDDVAVLNSDVLPESIIINQNAQSDFYWIPSYIIDVLRSGDRDTIFLYENFPKSIQTESNGIPWFEIIMEPLTFDFRNTDIILMAHHFFTNFYFLIDNIEKNSQFFTLKLLLPENGDYNETKRELSLRINSVRNMPVTKNAGEINLIFEYNENKIRIYNDQTNRLIFDLIKVSFDFYNDYVEFIKTNKVPSNLIISDAFSEGWKGDIKISPPFTSKKTIYRPTTEVHLRLMPNTGGGVLTTIQKNEAVLVLESGLSATIDNITAPWMWVETQDGVQGWCFAGYLEPVAETAGQDTPGEAAEEQPLPHDSGDAPEESAEPAEKGMPFLGIAAALLALGAAVVIIVLRKKRSRHPDDK